MKKFLWHFVDHPIFYGAIYYGTIVSLCSCILFACDCHAKELKMDVPFLIGDKVKISATQDGIIIGIYLFLESETVYTVMNFDPPYRVGQIGQKTLIGLQAEIQKKAKEPKFENL